MALFEWALGMNPVLALILITFIPLLELRASIPFGILALKLPWWHVAVVCILINTLVGPFMYLFLGYALRLFCKWGFFDRHWKAYVKRTQRRIQPSVDKWGWIGVVLFIGIPLPGTGVYTGAIGSYILGLKFRKMLLASFLGALMAGIIVTVIVLTGSSAFNFLVKTF